MPQVPKAQATWAARGRRRLNLLKFFVLLFSRPVHSFIQDIGKIDFSLDLVLQIDWAHYIKQVHEIDGINFVDSID